MNGSENKFQTYNGKELEESLGLNIYEMDFRQYNATIGRFNAIDRLSEFAHSITPYRFALNNPNYFSDPTGLFETRREARKYRRANDLKGRIKNEDGTFVIYGKDGNTYEAGNDSEFAMSDNNPDDGVIQSVTVIASNDNNTSSNDVDPHNLSQTFRKISGYALAVQKPLEKAFKTGTRYPSQLYPGHRSNVRFEKSILGKKVVVPIGNYNTQTIGKLSSTLKIAGRTFGAVGVVSGGVSIYNEGLNWSNGLDTTMSVLALSPTGVGQAIAGTYFLLNAVSQLTTDKDIGQHIQEAIDGE